MINKNALISLLALTGTISLTAEASYYEACHFSGTVQTIPEPRDNGIFFHILVESSKPIVCKSQKSYTPNVCSEYLNKTFEVGLASADAPNLAKGNHFELVQVVVDLYTGSEPTTQTYWQPVSDCQ